MNKKYIVRLSDEERHQLTELTSKGNAAASRIRHAHILLKADADGPAWTDAKIAESFAVSVNTVLGVRQRLVDQGLEAARNRKPQELLGEVLGPRPTMCVGAVGALPAVLWLLWSPVRALHTIPAVSEDAAGEGAVAS